MDMYMRNRKGLWFVLVLINFYSVAYASPLESINIAPSRILNHQFDKKMGHTYILDDYSVFVVKQGRGNVIVTAAIFYPGSVRREIVAEKMLWILKITSAQDKFINWARKSYNHTQRLNRSSFIYPPVKSYNKQIHEFSLSMIGFEQLSILTYRRLKPKK